LADAEENRRIRPARRPCRSSAAGNRRRSRKVPLKYAHQPGGGAPSPTRLWADLMGRSPAAPAVPRTASSGRFR
jgi:hypothetical protein